MTDIPLSMIRNHRPHKSRAELNRQKNAVHGWQFDNPIAYGNIQTGESWDRLQEIWDMEGVEVLG